MAYSDTSDTAPPSLRKLSLIVGPLAVRFIRLKKKLEGKSAFLWRSFQRESFMLLKRWSAHEAPVRFRLMSKTVDT